MNISNNLRVTTLTIVTNLLATINVMAVERDSTFNTNGNPIIKHLYTADPSAMVSNNRIYIYAGHDECPPPSEYYLINEWCVFSSIDLKTWTEHPVPLKARDFTWAKGEAWASQVIERNGKFYWYVTVEHASIPGKALGVAVADSPIGPFSDARGSALITNDMTSQYTSIGWDDIDPTVFIDHDGQAYIFWGNTQCYYAKLKANMTELDGKILPVDLNNIDLPAFPKPGFPHYTEAPWVHYRKGWYYLSFAIEFPEKIAYAMSRSINGPWEYKGVINEISGNCNTNHQAIVEFNDKWYFVYHNGAINTNGGSFRRSVCIDRLFYNKNGTIKRIIMTSNNNR